MTLRACGIGCLAGVLAGASLACTSSQAAGPDGIGPADAADAADVAIRDSSPEAAIDVPAGDAVGGNPEVLVGSFIVSLLEAVVATSTSEGSDAYSQVVGMVFDGPSPSLTQWSETAREGACRLLIPSVPFCSESCGGAAACVADEVCQAYPASVNVGTVSVQGVRTGSGASTFSLDPVANGYQTVDALPFPPFDQGDDVRVEASGGEIAPFVVASRGIAPLDLVGDTFRLARDQPLAVAWVPPAVTGLSTIHVKLDISHHGGSKGKIECDADDLGSLEVPASLVTQLLDLGVAGFPTIVVGRHALGAVTIGAGRVELDVVSDLEVAVEVPGITSCNGDEDCDDGQACRADLTCG